MKYKFFPLRDEIKVRSMVTCFYFELSKTYSNKGEKHNFWEIVYVDKGEAVARTRTGVYALKQGDLVFHEPNEFHSLGSNGNTAPIIFIITFVCTSTAMGFFGERKRFRLGEFERNLLAQLMKEGLQLAKLLNDNPSLPREDVVADFATGQLVASYLETLLIQLVRHYRDKDERPFPSTTKKNHANQMADRIIEFLSANLAGKWTLEQLCAELGIGRTQMNILLKNKTGNGVIAHMNHLRIEKAKAYIRDEVYNLTEISALLGYSSVHYFSRHFKKTVGMTPSEYARIINQHGEEPIRIE